MSDSTHISQLLLEISQRRSQAVELARALEQSIYKPHVFGNDVDSGDEAGDLLSEDGELESSSSFLDDFTRDFVDYHYTPPGPRTQVEKVKALCLSGPEEEEEEEEERDLYEEREHKDEEREGHEDRGVSKIDYAARQRIWGKIGKSANASSEEEARIAALVERAEQLSLDPPAPPLPPKQPDSAVVAEPPVFVQAWAPSEWERWAAHKASGGSAGPLDWVHALQPNSWEHGFRDTPCSGGKLLRTYSGLPLTLHSYADGNVKRTAMLKADSVATTLFFDNGDWSCTIVSQGPPQSYYYYCEEGVWHEQCADKQVYKYKDGSVESIVGGVATVVERGGGGGSSAHVIA